VPAVMGSVLADSPAEQGGLKAGDKVIEAGGKVIEDWFAFVDVIKVSAEKDVVVKVERSGENNGLIVETLSLRPEVFIREDGASVGRLGV
ncbi:PDZ domain-containing protein, partial [Oleiphilus sp. HI0117]